MTPKVSVVMSVYNNESYIREAVESVLNQSFKDFEFIIINDGSTDRTREILTSYTDERIRLFDQENRGLTISLNRGLSLAKGSYIARMDGDDISDPERFAEEVRFLEQNEKIGLIGTYAHRIDEQGRIVSLS
jgi:glycosyltransferase involved in cell wall biosynthesis